MLYIANQAGLVTYNGSRFTGIANISEGDIFDVELDKNERVWLMTRTGIYFFDPAYEIWDGWTYLELGVVLDFLSNVDEYIQCQGFEFDPLRKCFWLGGETGLLKLEIHEDFAPTLDSIIVYPNPAVAGGVVRLKNIAADTKVNVYSISGRLVAKDLQPNDLFCEVTWVVPRNIGSGLYFAIVRSGSTKKMCKFAIVK
jgi:ligand-binding sensor domain-containing protein